MLNTRVFEDMIYNSKINSITEQEVTLEAWMMDSALFGEYIGMEKTVDEEIKLEAWMLDEVEFSEIVK
jgi:hypothetical protein